MKTHLKGEVVEKGKVTEKGEVIEGSHVDVNAAEVDHSPEDVKVIDSTETTRVEELTLADRIAEENATPLSREDYIPFLLAQEQREAESKARNLRVQKLNEKIERARARREAFTKDTGLVEKPEVEFARLATEQEAFVKAKTTVPAEYAVVKVDPVI